MKTNNFLTKLVNPPIGGFFISCIILVYLLLLKNDKPMNVKKFNADRDMKAFLKTLKKEAAKTPVVNAVLKKRLSKIVKHLIAKEFREEAIDILMKSNDKEIIGKFMYYYYSDITNVACMVIDTAKDILVLNKKMKQLKTDKFGTPNGKNK